MKTTVLLAIALMATAGFARAQYVIDPTPYYTHTSSDAIVSYDWDASNNLYYQTSVGFGNFGGVYEFNGTTTTNPVAGTSDFVGGSVVVLGNYVYFNTSDFTDQKIYSFQAGTTPTNPLTPISTALNYGLTKNGGSLFITAAPSPTFTNHIYSTVVTGSGTFVSNPPTDLGADSGGSGPLAFDAAGNLYFAPGFGDQSIYKWSAADVAAALANPGTSPLNASGHLWADYSTNPEFNIYSGGTSMLVEGNELLLTLTNFNGPSSLVEFGIAGNGTSNGTSNTILQTNGLYGQLQDHNGTLYLSEGNTIYQLNAVPEPSSYLLLGLGALAVVIWRRRFAGEGGQP